MTPTLPSYDVGPDVWATAERRALRALVTDFVTREVTPHLAGWEQAGEVPRSLHRAAAAAGLLGLGFPEAVGGQGGGLLDAVTLAEQLLVAGGSGGLQAALFTSGIALPHIVAAGDPPLIDRFVRPTLAGDMIGALAVTEPDGGSDVAALRTTAVRDGGEYVVNGAKTYITSGMRADFLTTAVRTGGPGYAGVSLLVIETDRPGVSRSRLSKMGWHCSDTASIGLTDVRVPIGNLVGTEGAGFVLIMGQFQTERLSLAATAVGTAQRCLNLTVEWVRERSTFGKPLAHRQVVRHALVEMHRRTDVARAYLRAAAEKVVRGDDAVVEVSLAKNTAVEACDWVVDKAVQLHGGMGYMREAEVERHYRDARLLGIGGGSTEVMTELAAKRLGW